MFIDRKKPRCNQIREGSALCAMIGHRRFYRWIGEAYTFLIGQSLSAFRASSLKNVSAVCSLHSLSEAMLLLSLKLLGLVSSEHFLHLLIDLSEAFRFSAILRFYTMTSSIIHTKAPICQVFFEIFSKMLSFFRKKEGFQAFSSRKRQAAMAAEEPSAMAVEI